MSGVQSSLFWFPGPGARGSRLVGLWVTEMESCQGYHDGSLRCGWLAASCLNNATEQRMVVGVVPVETVRLSRCESRLQVVVGAHRLSRPPCCSQDAGAVAAGAPLGVRWQHRQDVLGEGGEWQDRESWSADGARYKSREVGGRKSKWAMEGGMLVPHSGPRAGPQSNRPGAGAGVPCREFATKMRVQAWRRTARLHLGLCPA